VSSHRAVKLAGKTRRQSAIHADWIITAWIWTGLLAVLLPTRADPDLWGHLRFGSDFLATRVLTYADPYSFTQDRPWINHEWLSEAQMALAYRLAGVTGLLVLKLALMALGLWILAGALRHLPILVRSGCLLLAAWAAVVPMTLTIRPQLWSWLFTISLARLLLSDPSRRLLLPVSLLLAIWMNSHGGVLIGVALLGIWTGYYLWKSPERRWLALTVGCCGLASTLLNPYGVRLWQFLGETVRIGREIREWGPIWRAPLVAWGLPWALAVIAIVGTTMSRERPRIDRLAAVLLLAYASARTMRLVPLFVVITLIYLAPSLERLSVRRWMSWRLTAPSRVAAWAALAPLVAFAAFVHVPAWTRTRECLPVAGDWAPDQTVAAALRASSPNGRLVTSFAWGQYAIWHLGPALRVSFDGRLETVYSDATDQRQVAIERGEPAGLAFLADTRPEFVWLGSASGRTRNWLAGQPEYRFDLETPASFLAVRSDQPVITPATQVPAACFPG
jgi:hypothetical protein